MNALHVHLNADKSSPFLWVNVSRWDAVSLYRLLFVVRIFSNTFVVHLTEVDMLYLLE